jgi:hypothetical protein
MSSITEKGEKRGQIYFFNFNRHLPNLATLPFSANGHGSSCSISEETQTIDNSNNPLPGWDAIAQVMQAMMMLTGAGSAVNIETAMQKTRGLPPKKCLLSFFDCKKGARIL